MKGTYILSGVVIVLVSISLVLASNDFGYDYLEHPEASTGGGGSSNVSSFLNLSDTPNSYAGEGGNCVAVNVGETGLEFIACGSGSGDFSFTDFQSSFNSNISATGILNYKYNQTTPAITFASNVNSSLYDLFIPLNYNMTDIYTNGTGLTLDGNQFNLSQNLYDLIYNYTNTFLETEPAWNGNYSIFVGLINNASYLSTYNATYDSFAYNQSLNTYLNNILNPYGDTTFTIGGNDVTWRFTNPVGRILYNYEGGASGHLFIINQSGGNPMTGTHMLHIQAEDDDVTLLHLLHTGSPTEPIFEVEGGDVNFSGELYLQGGVAVSPWLYNQSYPWVNGTWDYNMSDGSGATSWQFGATSIYNATSGVNVGIGTSSPNNPLEIMGTDGLLRLSDTGDGDLANPFIEYYNSSSRKGYVGWGSSGNNNFYISLSDADLTIPAGNVGIGTQTPTEKLQVIAGKEDVASFYASGSGASSGTYNLVNITGTISDDAGITNGLYVDLKTTGALAQSSQRGVYVDASGSNFDYGVYVNDADYNYFDGYVGIGDTDPDNLLTIKSTSTGEDFIRMEGASEQLINFIGALGADQGYVQIFDNGTAKILLRADSGSSYWNAGGGFGFGDTSPTGKVQIAGDELRIGSDTVSCSVATGDGDICIKDTIEIDGNTWIGDDSDGDQLNINAYRYDGAVSSGFDYVFYSVFSSGTSFNCDDFCDNTIGLSCADASYVNTLMQSTSNPSCSTYDGYNKECKCVDI